MDLGSTRRLAHELKLKFAIPTIHVTGSSGKGSVVFYICGMLMAAGLKVGSFVSPHLIEPRDSILIDNIPVAEARYNKVRATVTDVSAGQNSAFEVLTLSALLLFQYYDVDVAVVECGVGAAWDATMVIPDDTVLAGVITSVSLDHVGLLGLNEKEIARSKSCVARLGRPFVLSRTIDPELLQVLTAIVKPLRCPVIISPTVDDLDDTGGTFTLFGVRNLALRMKGQHQVQNFSVAAATVLNLLGHLGTLLKQQALHQLRIEDVLMKAAKTVRVPGRLECLPWPPLPTHRLKHNLTADLGRYSSSESFKTCSTATSTTRHSSNPRAGVTRHNTMPLSICVRNQSFYFDPPGVHSRLGDTKRLVWLDGAHNEAGLRAIEPWLRRCDLAVVAFSTRRGVLESDKQLGSLIKALAPCKRVCFTNFTPPEDLPGVQCLDPILCCRLYSSILMNGATSPANNSPLVGAFEDLTAVFEEAERIYHNNLAKNRTTIEVVVTGSLYLVAEYYKQFLTKR